ncbi:hypothetical protein DACRYDRAFT_99262 [Dacryopinax primogenitus]|uniref:Uncharacterized protein n=1 Tax=Dacryopinax primogenitus (strain DJM 731) TaxID=1858805 RepID=M5G0E1_DACPD|nr:uncharacterized protein DACRYDRAFT_99262 [Dacryopinax primogenitus]EJU03711.1 hypothetical protein DACRYDRAFT_99262 [Dacryopinax primogenitus]
MPLVHDKPIDYEMEDIACIEAVPSPPSPPESPQPGLPDTLSDAPVCDMARAALADDLINDVGSDKQTTLNVAPELDLGRKSAYHGPKGIRTRKYTGSAIIPAQTHISSAYHGPNGIRSTQYTGPYMDVSGNILPCDVAPAMTAQDYISVITTETDEVVHSMHAARRELNRRRVAAFKNWFFRPSRTNTGQLLSPPPDGNNAGQSDVTQSAADAMVMPGGFTPASGC